jgi:hypothetical protein
VSVVADSVLGVAVVAQTELPVQLEGNDSMFTVLVRAVEVPTLPAAS